MNIAINVFIKFFSFLIVVIILGIIIASCVIAVLYFKRKQQKKQGNGELKGVSWKPSDDNVTLEGELNYLLYIKYLVIISYSIVYQQIDFTIQCSSVRPLQLCNKLKSI